MSRPSRHVHDDGLGYVPRPGHAEPGLTIDADGLRSAGEAALASSSAPPILAVGDSFTFGDDVADGESWPAQLERLAGRRVLNGGVSGYGFDQIVLRGEQLAAWHRPSVIVAGFIADDIQRTEMRRLWRHDKPWFEPGEGGRLVPRGVPVPRPPGGARGPWLRRFDLVVRRLPPLHQPLGYHLRAQAAGTGETVACRLTERLATLQKSSGARVVVLAEYDAMAWTHAAFAAEQRRLTGGLLRCATERGLATLDSFATLAAAPAPRELYGRWHMNARGNLQIARLVAGFLSRIGA